MSQPLIYLSGPITDCTYEEATEWRHMVTYALNTYGLKVLDPMRTKEHLKNLETLRWGTYADSHPLSSVVGISMRDFLDCSRASGALVYLDTAPPTSPCIGTYIELGWLTAHHKPVVLVDNRKNSCGWHPLLQQRVIKVPTLEDAVEVLVGLFPV
jgi:nucleoside 2-deoxyribosyltransferase